MASRGESDDAPLGWGPLHLPNPEAPGIRSRDRMCKNIDHGRLVKRLWFVGASGFFATGYTFFARNVTKPEQYYVYPPCGRLGSNASMVMDELTLLDAAIGMLAAGTLADLHGRKKLYGYELALLILATLGIVQASEGFRSRRADGSSTYTMDIYSWLAWWRFWLGIAIGSEHPLVAIITAEWVRTKSRGRMLAAIFAVQPIARLAAYGIGLAAFNGLSSANGLSPDAVDDGELWKHVADQVWRWVTGIAIIPALLAVGFRFTIPETPLYYADIASDTIKGLKEMAAFYPDVPGHGAPPRTETTLHLSVPTTNPTPPINSGADSTASGDNSFSIRKWYTGAIRTLRTKAAGRNLSLLCLLWLLTDVSWYSLALDSPSAMATLWANPSVTASSSLAAESAALADGGSCPEFSSWRADPSNPSTSVYREFEHSAKRFMLVVCVGAILGSLALIAIVNRVHRRVLLMATCGALSALFAVSGAVMLGTRGSPVSTVAIDVLFGVMHFLFTLGPRTLVLIMAVELFPTVYRGTFYGMAAAAGKLGAIIIRPIIGQTGKLDLALGIRLMVAVVLMAACVVISYFLPGVQREGQMTDIESEEEEGDDDTPTGKDRQWVALLFPKLKTMTLEELETMALKDM